MSFQNLSFRKNFLILGAILGLLAVILGAFAAHGLKPKINPESLTSFETGVRFQMYHALLCLAVGTMGFIPEKMAKRIFYLLLSGVIFFSGSIYLLSTKELTGIDLSSIALITPLGGLLLISGWTLLVVSFSKIKVK